MKFSNTGAVNFYQSTSHGAKTNSKMGRERQKFKNRSSVSKVTQKPKSKKKILHNSIIAANWYEQLRRL